MLSRRLGYAILGGGLLTLIVLVGRLEPSASGRGTHRQLGLPPCAFETLTGLRCPTCGVTTAGCHLARGNIAQAVTAHATGTVLVGGMVLGGVGLMLAALIGWQLTWLTAARVEVTVAAAAAMALVEWLVRLVVERFG